MNPAHYSVNSAITDAPASVISILINHFPEFLCAANFGKVVIVSNANTLVAASTARLDIAYIEVHLLRGSVRENPAVTVIALRRGTIDRKLLYL